MTEQREDQQRSKKRSIKRWVISGVSILLICAVAVGAILYEQWRNSPTQVLATSFQNTLSLQKLTFHVAPSSQATSTDQLSTKFDGQYDKTIGYAVTATVTAQTAHYKVGIDMDYVLDLASSTAFYRPNKTVVTPKATADQQESNTIQQALQQAFKSEWVKMQMNKGQESNYVCMATALQTLQSKPELGKKLLTALVATKTATVQVVSSDNDATTFALQAKNDQADTLVQAYMNTDMYKNYAACAAPSEDTAAALRDAAKQYEIRVRIDRHEKRIEEITLLDKQNKNAEVFRLTIVPAQNVTITVPKNVTATSASPDLPFTQ